MSADPVKPITERLRKTATGQRASGWPISAAMCDEAADEIDRLDAKLVAAQAEIERLRFPELEGVGDE